MFHVTCASRFSVLHRADNVYLGECSGFNPLPKWIQSCCNLNMHKQSLKISVKPHKSQPRYVHRLANGNCNGKLEISTAPTKAKSREPAYSHALLEISFRKLSVTSE